MNTVKSTKYYSINIKYYGKKYVLGYLQKKAQQKFIFTTINLRLKIWPI